MNDAVWASLLTFLGGASVLKLVESYLARGRSREDELVVFRRELRAENAQLRTDLTACQGQLAEARAEVRVLSAQVESLRAQLNGRG